MGPRVSDAERACECGHRRRSFADAGHRCLRSGLGPVDGHVSSVGRWRVATSPRSLSTPASLLARTTPDLAEPRRRPDLRVVRDRQRRQPHHDRADLDVPHHPERRPRLRRRRRHRRLRAHEDTATGNIVAGIDGTVCTTGDNVYQNGTADRLHELLRPDVGHPVDQVPDATDPRQPRLGPWHHRTTSPATTATSVRPRPMRTARATTATTSPSQQLARRQPRQRVRRSSRRLHRRLTTGTLARSRPRGQQQQERHRRSGTGRASAQPART